MTLVETQVDRQTLLQTTYSQLEYTPYPEQWPILLCDRRKILVSGGEQAGKSYTGAKYLVGRWPEWRLAWICAADYERCRPEFQYCLEDFHRLGVMTQYHAPERDQCSLELLGGRRLVTKSLRDVTKIGMEAPDIILVCEVAQVSYLAYTRLIARTARRRGILIGTGTFEGSLGWYPELWDFYRVVGQDDVAAFSLPSWTNKEAYPGGREDAEIKRQERELPDDIFQERFAAVPCRPGNLVIKEFANRIHVGEYPFDPSKPVEIAVDPGVRGAYAVLAIQERDGQLVLIDEIYETGYVTSEIVTIAKQRPWWGQLSGGTGDIAAKESREVWSKDAGITLRTKKVDVEAGIDLLRTHLKPNPITGRPNIVVDARCAGFIAECGGGKSPVRDGGAWVRDEHTLKPKPGNDHSCKALIYYIASRIGFGSEQRQRVKTVRF